MSDAPVTRTVALDRPLDLRLTLGPTRVGRGDLSTRLRSTEALRAASTPEGAVTLHLKVVDSVLEAQAWGPGARWALRQVPALIGQHDTAEFAPDHPLVADLAARFPGLRIGATHRIFDALLPAICAQHSSGFEARRAHRQIVEAYGTPAPGPVRGLVVPPTPRVIADAPYQDLHTLGLERARADALRRAAARAMSVESIVDDDPVTAEGRLRSMTGVGVWTAAVIRAVALGDPDAVPVGDPMLRHVVVFAFTGNRRGTDAQMLDLLDRFRGQRGRVIQLLRAGRIGPPALDADAGER